MGTTTPLRPESDFFCIVQTSTNRVTGAIRRGLRDYNGICCVQRENVDVDEPGAGEEEFVAVASARCARASQG